MDNAGSVKLNVNFSIQQLVDAVKQLSSSDKLKINEALWQDNMDIPYSHQQLVLDKIKHAKLNPGQLLDWDEASEKLVP